MRVYKKKFKTGGGAPVLDPPLHVIVVSTIKWEDHGQLSQAKDKFRIIII